ncbi:hypothetical protein DFA_00551 [Cavenderia fasciculata]|uniref:RNB domain-containing protein n=1 Tax=Cavenderia fasciculata TaxID=261658 RepID=F4PSJ8_CACFS|nr:uncharacterized protein DFA_00551 [Cavenderia fasciculata]EGG20690.1 hypothetical protein DFA_00551 [Cavenderia fasciculata]|eukprot:XP_004358540.1 hypothetical protein DFA_00551 [Cavenderia fasciculata]
MLRLHSMSFAHVVGRFNHNSGGCTPTTTATRILIGSGGIGNYGPRYLCSTTRSNLVVDTPQQHQVIDMMSNSNNNNNSNPTITLDKRGRKRISYGKFKDHLNQARSQEDHLNHARSKEDDKEYNNNDNKEVEYNNKDIVTSVEGYEPKGKHNGIGALQYLFEEAWRKQHVRKAALDGVEADPVIVPTRGVFDLPYLEARNGDYLFYHGETTGGISHGKVMSVDTYHYLVKPTDPPGPLVKVKKTTVAIVVPFHYLDVQKELRGAIDRLESFLGMKTDIDPKTSYPNALVNFVSRISQRVGEKVDHYEFENVFTRTNHRETTMLNIAPVLAQEQIHHDYHYIRQAAIWLFGPLTKHLQVTPDPFVELLAFAFRPLQIKNEKDIPELILKLAKHLENNLQRCNKTPKTDNKYEGRLLATTNYGMHPPFQQFGLPEIPKFPDNRLDPISKHYTTPSFRIKSPLTQSKDDIALGLYQENDTDYLLIHVPNIAHIIENSHFIDNWAAKRGQAVELSKSIVPMIPFGLTEYLRMKPNKTSDCWTFQIELDKSTGGIKMDAETMEISHFKLYPSKVDNIVMVDSNTQDIEEIDPKRPPIKAKNIVLADMPQPKQLQKIFGILKMRNGNRTQSLFSSPHYRGRYVYNRETDSHEFVASCLASFMATEATITANHLASVYCLQNKLSIPHIGQPNPNASNFPIETLGRVYNQTSVLHEYSKIYRPDKITLSKPTPLHIQPIYIHWVCITLFLLSRHFRSKTNSCISNRPSRNGPFPGSSST